MLTLDCLDGSSVSILSCALALSSCFVGSGTGETTMEITVKPEAKRSLIFSYGTLKRGFANHNLMQHLISSNDAVYLGRYRTLDELPLVCGPYGVPFLLNLPAGPGRHPIRGELYGVSDPGLARIDELEGVTVGHYERFPVRLIKDREDGEGGAVVEAEAYYLNRSFGEEMWRRNGKVGFGEYTEKKAREYVRRDERPKERSFLEEIRLFVSSSSSSS
ncbi:putative gamma-glutamylcyclotransferase At3g02910 [Rhododendron vialii]|uniref:putative gamma-glutamylcyclotransferase At3g02910 n=1 Tax=Rhododendron vialii TaxID=182163 RepID=UPI00265D8978|nr:putative gamma-glutamylcyclotransferase At3g02910 [Rhododendron vialii]